MKINEEFENLRLENEKGKIAVKELSYEQINKLSEYAEKLAIKEEVMNYIEIFYE